MTDDTVAPEALAALWSSARVLDETGKPVIGEERTARRAERHAEAILGCLLRRRRWSAADRDRLAGYIASAITHERAEAIREAQAHFASLRGEPA